MLKYDVGRRAFVISDFRGLEDLGAKKLVNLSDGVVIHELYWKQVVNAYQRTKHPGLGKALEQFNKTLKIPSVPKIPGSILYDYKMFPMTTPTGTRLYDYQRVATPYLAYGSMILGDEMGLGKTLCCLWAWYLFLRNKKLTVIVPSDSVGDEWVIALEEHLGITEGVVSLTKPTSGTVIRNARVVIIPYSRYWRENYESHIDGRVTSDSVLIFDEAHRLSVIDSRQHHFAYHLCLKNPWRWALSGTEVSNTPESYYGIYRCLTLTKLTKVAWMEHVYCQWSNNWADNKIKEIRVLRKSFALRRTVEDVNHQLPPKTIVDIKVPLDDISRTIYDDLHQTSQAEIQNLQGENVTITIVHYMTIYGKCLQLCSHPSLIEESRVQDTPKYNRLVELIESSGRHRVIIWSNFPRSIEWLTTKLRMAFPNKKIARAHGGVSQEERKELKRDFQAKKYDVLIANPAVWAEGVNLTAATVNIYYDYHASRVRYEQTLKRSHRLGQTKPVIIYRLLTKNSVEEKLVKWLERKTQLAELITGKS